MTWDPLTSPIDWFLLAGKKSPGLSAIDRPNSPRKWDEQSSFGWSGATLRFAGIGLSKYSIRVRLYTKEDWRIWNEEFEPLLLRPPAGKKPRAQVIWHPFLLAKQIFATVIEDVVGPEQVDDGVWEHVIECKQYRERRYQLAKPDAVKDEPKDPVDALIDQKADVARGLMAELAK